jgi:hypothetical protein
VVLQLATHPTKEVLPLHPGAQALQAVCLVLLKAVPQVLQPHQEENLQVQQRNQHAVLLRPLQNPAVHQHAANQVKPVQALQQAASQVRILMAHKVVTRAAAMVHLRAVVLMINLADKVAAITAQTHKAGTRAA